LARKGAIAAAIVSAAGRPAFGGEHMHMQLSTAPAPDRVVFESGLVTIGAFRCRREHPAFEDSGAIERDCFVFPRTAVGIQREHERAFVANPNVVTFYNRGDQFRRAPISADGDRADWFALRRDVVREIVAATDRGAADRDAPFALSHAASDPRVYLLQRRLHNAVTRLPPPDPLVVEETTVSLLRRVLSGEAERRPARAQPRHVELVEAAKALLSAHFLRPLTLADVAARLDVSVFHLCRVFQRSTGTTLHEYRHQLRLRWSLEQMASRPHALVQCALDAGFSSHSHWGAAFRQAFGETPTQALASEAR
jgi:AraC-like DNA-binding protein